MAGVEDSLGIEPRAKLYGSSLDVRVHSIEEAARDVLLFDLRPRDDRVLPSFGAGAHIDVHLPNGRRRSYSLVNDPGERHRYMIAVQCEASGRGGSLWMHQGVSAGGDLQISAPENAFPMYSHAPNSIFIAGGIGITPLWCMIQVLLREGRPWFLYHSARSQAAAVFRNDISAHGERHVGYRFSDDPAAGRFNIEEIVAAATPETHFYCCGPGSMLEDFKRACRNIHPGRVHFEYFGAQQEAAQVSGIRVRLARTGIAVTVNDGESILEAVQRAGVSVPSSCQQGVCGTCETTVLDGVPDHRDIILSEEERASNRTMMICCSGALTDYLELDL